MKKSAACFFILVLTFLIGFIFYTNSSTGIAENEVLNLVKQFHHAQIYKNEAELKRILSDKIQTFRLSEPTNATQEKLLTTVKQAEIESIKTDFVFIDVTGENAKVSFEMNMKFRSDTEIPVVHHGSYVYLFEKQQGEWKLIEIHLEN